MAEKIREVSTIPDPSLGRKLAQSGHSFYEAIAELIDNSFDARATDIDIDITNAQDAKHNITISDNGLGMNLKELTSAITLAKSAKSSDNGDLGLFGLGMKTSLGALGMLHEIETSKKGSAKRFIYRNNDNIPKTEHKAKIVERDDAPKNSSYTIVRIGDLKFLTKDKISVLKEKTAKRYSKILDNGYTTLTINNTKIDAISVEFNKNVSQINGTITYNGNLYNYLLGM
jgi:DNA topoisomerase VI subunit B